MTTQSKKTSKTNTSKIKKSPIAAKKVAKTTAVKAAKVTKPVASSTQPTKKSRMLFRKRSRDTKSPVKQLSSAALVAWQKWLALLFAAQGVAILLLSTTSLVSVSGNYLANDALASRSGETVNVPAVSHLFDANLAYLVAGICFVFAVASLLSATLYRAAYEQALARKVNRFRWVTFSFGLGGLVVLLGLLVGAQDVVSLLMLFVLTVIVSMTGLGLELLGAAQQQARSVISSIGTIAWLTLWAVIALYFVYAGVYEGNVPDYVYFVAATTLLISVAFVSLLRRQQLGLGKWADYLRVERAYLVMSFVLVSAVVWQVYVGTLQP